MKRMTVTAMSVLVAWLAVAVSASAATPKLAVLGSQAGERTVVFSRAADDSLTGQVVMALRSGVAKKSTLGVAYYPAGSLRGASAGSVEFADGKAPVVKKGRIASAALVFTLPPSSSPADLKGIVVLRTTGAAKGQRASVQLEVAGAGSTLPGVSIRPQKLDIKVVDEQGPFGDPQSAYAKVQLAGPGVPSLFRDGATPPAFNLLLRSDHGDTARARLVDVAEGSDPTLATATVRVQGDLDAGKYEGEAPISSLSPDAPKLAIAIESGDSVVYAVLAVLLGTALGGGLYLASNRHRRKVLLRDQVKSMLDLYEKRLAELQADAGDGGLPVWSLAGYLGEERNWYTVKWNSIVNFDGAVRTVWSEIHWARDDGDLEHAAAQVAELRARIVRWLTVANSIRVLRAAVELEPNALPNEPWRPLCVLRDSTDLLQLARRLEPDDDQTAATLVERIECQAHWHTVLARAWHAKAALTRDMDRRDGYRPNDTAALQAIDLSRLDKGASPETGRKVEQQIALEHDLAAAREAIRSMFKGEASELELPGVGSDADGALPPLGTALAVTGAILEPSDGALLAPELTAATRAQPGSAAKAAALLRGSTALDHAGARIPAAVKGVLYRDLSWTIVIALVSSVVYILSGAYNASWGTATDYVSAFAAGFIGKAVISWAGLPLFQSIRAAASSAPAATAGATAATPSPAAPTPAPVAPVPPQPPAVPAPAPAPAQPGPTGLSAGV